VNPDSPAEIRALLHERGLSLKKRWGQNFLVNKGARQRLVSLLAPEPQETIWEIGPGLGAMTAVLVDRSRHVLAFEIDRGLCRYLEESLGNRPSFLLVPGDFLDTGRETAVARGRPDRILGNLPYSSASIIVASILEGQLPPHVMIFTVQKELAERMSSRPGVKSYSSFSVLCQACCSVKSRGDLKPGSFYPAPEVISSVVEMRPRQDAASGEMLNVLSSLVRGLFSSRRKTIRNNLALCRLPAGLSPERVLEAMRTAGIEPGGRAEQVSPDAYLALARTLKGFSIL
jgi:16S rRNA (adenine1518-N6/adenine1519-N6)-dimethyltransferase